MVHLKPWGPELQEILFLALPIMVGNQAAE
jgi:hypothetical protein